MTVQKIGKKSADPNAPSPPFGRNDFFPAKSTPDFHNALRAILPACVSVLLGLVVFGLDLRLDWKPTWDVSYMTLLLPGLWSENRRFFWAAAAARTPHQKIILERQADDLRAQIEAHVTALFGLSATDMDVVRAVPVPG